MAISLGIYPIFRQPHLVIGLFPDAHRIFYGFLPGRGQYPEIYSDWPKMLDGQMKQYVDKMVHGLLNTNEHLVLATEQFTPLDFCMEMRMGPRDPGTQGPIYGFGVIARVKSSPTNTWRKGLPGSEKICLF